jgi:thioredoxin 2
MAAYQLDDRGVVTQCSQCGQKNRLLYNRLGDVVRCGSCKKELSGVASPIEIKTSAEFDRLIGQSSVPVIVDYWAPWCGPCRMVAPELEKVAARANGRFVIVKVNTDALTDLGERYKIRSIPTLGVFAGGREVTRTTGARPAADIEAFISGATQTASRP